MWNITTTERYGCIKNQKIEITDKFKDDVCYVKVQDGDETLYVTVKYQNGLAYSNEKYVEEDEFN